MKEKLLPLALRARLLGHLASLLARGVSLLEALPVCADELPPRRRESLEEGLRLAKEGAPLGSVLVEGGCVGGADKALLESTAGRSAGRPLGLLADEIRTQAELRQLLIQVLRRPTWTTLCALLFALVLLPAFLTATGLIYNYAWHGGAWEFLWNLLTPGVHQGTDLPLHQETTLRVLTVTCFLLAAAVFFSGCWKLYRSRRLRRLLEYSLWETPVLCEILGAETGSRFHRALGTGLAAGLTLPAALERAAAAFGERAQAEEIRHMADKARDGTPLAACLSKASFLDETSKWLVDQCQSRADLPSELLLLAARQQEEFQREVRGLIPMVGMVANVLLALPVLGYAYATYAVSRQLLFF